MTEYRTVYRHKAGDEVEIRPNKPWDAYFSEFFTAIVGKDVVVTKLSDPHYVLVRPPTYLLSEAQKTYLGHPDSPGYGVLLPGCYVVPLKALPMCYCYNRRDP